MKQQRLLKIILSASPEHLKPHIKDCVINDKRLMVYVSSAVWASQLRFCSAQIMQAVKNQGNESIHKIRIRVLSPEPFKLHKEVIKKIPSRENIELLRENADSLADSKLKSALLSLSQVLQKHRH